MIDLVCFQRLTVTRTANVINTAVAFAIYINPEKVVTVTEAYPGPDIERDRPMTCITFVDDTDIIVGATIGETVHRLRGDTL